MKTITYTPRGGGSPNVEYAARVDEYEPGFAEGTDVATGEFVVVYWDGDEWVAVETTEG